MKTEKRIRPLYDRVVIEREKDVNGVTAGGLIIPDAAKEQPNYGNVIAAGHGRLGTDGTVTPLCVKVGDVVMFGKYAGSEIDLDGEKYLMMREDEILGVIELASV